MKYEVVVVLTPFLSFVIKFEKNRANNMIIFYVGPISKGWIWSLNVCAEKLPFALLKNMTRKLGYP